MSDLSSRNWGAGSGTTDPVVLLVHDDFGAGVVEALLNRADCPVHSFFAFRGACRANAQDAFDWTRHDGAGRWRPVSTPNHLDADHVLRHVIRHELGSRFDSRIDIFFLTTARRATGSNDYSPVADTIWRARRLFDGLGLVCAIVGAPDAESRDWLTNLDGSSGASVLFGDLLKKYDFDFVFRAHELREVGALNKTPDEANATTLANAAAIALLTFQPFASFVRERLDPAQLDLGRRAISINVAALNVDAAAIQGQIRSMLIRRLVESLLDLIDNAEDGSDDVTETEATTAKQLIDAAGWSVPAFKRLSSIYCDRLGSREERVLRDLIQDAGKAARAFANTRVKPQPPPVQHASRTPSVLTLLFGGLAVLVGIGVLLLAMGDAVVGLNWGSLAANGITLVLGSLLMVAVSLFLVFILRSRPKKENTNLVPDDFALLSANYRALRELHRRLRVEKNSIAVWERNVERSLHSIRAFLDSEIERKRHRLKVPDEIYIRLLLTRGDIMSVDKFVGGYPHGVKLLAADDSAATLSAIEQYADAFLARIGAFSWADLLHQLANTKNEGVEWLTGALQQLRRTSGEPPLTLDRSSWEIVAMPTGTPEVLATRVRATLPIRDELLCVTDDEFIVVRFSIIEFLQDANLSSMQSPL